LIYALPIGHSRPRLPGVTLLGDAAHVMSPYAGEGANLAMLDAADLALAIAGYGADVEAAVTRYEKTMFPRAAAAAEQSAQGLELCFAADAPLGIVHFFASMGLPERTERGLLKILAEFFGGPQPGDSRAVLLF
jgi:2-polyprenyl-6-methoxyphenol hydroxylase-like FAD-dependent oxidoreductase